MSSAGAPDSQPRDQQPGPGDGAPQPWWRSKLVISVLGVFGTLGIGVAPATSAITKAKDLQVAQATKEKELEVAEAEQRDKLRLQYLTLAVDRQHHDPEERRQTLRFLAKTGKDDPLRVWAVEELALENGELQRKLAARQVEAQGKARRSELLGQEFEDTLKHFNALQRSADRSLGGALRRRLLDLQARVVEAREQSAEAEAEVTRIRIELVMQRNQASPSPPPGP